MANRFQQLRPLWHYARYCLIYGLVPLTVSCSHSIEHQKDPSLAHTSVDYFIPEKFSAMLTNKFRHNPKQEEKRDRTGMPLPLMKHTRPHIAGLKPTYRTQYAYSENCLNAPSPLGAMPTHFWSDDPLNHVLFDHQKPARTPWGTKRTLPLSPGDLIEVLIFEGEEFSGNYVVNLDGNLNLPFTTAIPIQGLDTSEVENKIAMHLIKNDLFKPINLKVSVRTLQWAPIQVSVAGAVYNAGRQLINDKLPSQVHKDRTVAYGGYPATRFLSEALRAASGVRPDAKVSKVIVIRDGWQMDIDLSGIFSGAPVHDIPLIAGDHVVVPTTGCFQHELVRPSQITPKGFRVYISNLITPSKNNSAANVGKYSTSLPYGTKLLQAAVSGNCVGGIYSTDASRRVVLISKNPLTGQTEVILRSVEDLINHASRDEFNPYVLPEDAIACYDSTVTNIRDIARTLGDIVSPFTQFKYLFDLIDAQ
ncbi:MAG: polysaccharide biosynthesis protein [Gammaproteobacteria bacterium]|nr:MAG: polysaccharide biosynthesis protein [Gammaproteobacteria bacterium]